MGVPVWPMVCEGKESVGSAVDGGGAFPGALPAVRQDAACPEAGVG
jgi:hypothetical protein